MDNKKEKTLSEIIDHLDTGHYKEMIKKTEQIIFNIRSGVPKYYGVYDIRTRALSPKEAKESINDLNETIENYKKSSKELAWGISELHSGKREIEKLAEKYVLLYALRTAIVDRKIRKEQERTDILKENEKKYNKLYSNSVKPIKKEKLLINKKMNKVVGEILHEPAYKNSYGAYINLEKALEENNKSVSDIGLGLFSEFEWGYGSIFNFIDEPYYSRNRRDIKRLGADLDRIVQAAEKMKEDYDSYSITAQASFSYEAYINLKTAKKLNLNIAAGRYTITKLMGLYEQILELSREVWYIEEILASFGGTSIKDSEMYQGLDEMKKDFEQKLSKLIREADTLYKKSGVENKIELIHQLEELYRKCEEVKQALHSKEYEKLRQESREIMENSYYDKKFAMVEILLANPDLNDPKYGINLKDYKDMSSNKIKSELKNTVPSTPANGKKLTENNKVQNKIESAPKKETVSMLANEESLNKDDEVPNRTEEDSLSHGEISEEEKQKSQNFESQDFELNSNLQVSRTKYYQAYMIEKIKDSDLGKLSFSEYLEAVAPSFLSPLIRVEKQREAYARTIYKDYLIYYKSLEDKKYAMKFEEFALRYYNMNNIDVPAEEKDEYEEMINKGVKR